LNNDGKKDLVLGNKGNNTSYKASASNPMKMFVNDFDANGTIEQITTRTIDGKDIPVHLKSELAKQIPMIKKKNLSYDDYSKKSFQELFSPEIINNSIQKIVNTQESLIAINKGSGKFTVQALPKEVQLSTVNSICAIDLNKDGILDLILGGNQSGFKPQFGCLDTNYGSVLLGNKKGIYTWTSYSKSGFYLKGEVKHIQKIKNKNNSLSIIAVINDATPKIFKIND
jgi:hypothetical protein